MTIDHHTVATSPFQSESADSVTVVMVIPQPGREPASAKKRRKQVNAATMASPREADIYTDLSTSKEDEGRAQRSVTELAKSITHCDNLERKINKILQDRHRRSVSVLEQSTISDLVITHHAPKVISRKPRHLRNFSSEIAQSRVSMNRLDYLSAKYKLGETLMSQQSLKVAKGKPKIINRSLNFDLDGIDLLDSDLGQKHTLTSVMSTVSTQGPQRKKHALEKTRVVPNKAETAKKPQWRYNSRRD